MLKRLLHNLVAGIFEVKNDNNRSYKLPSPQNKSNADDGIFYEAGRYMLNPGMPAVNLGADCVSNQFSDLQPKQRYTPTAVNRFIYAAHDTMSVADQLDSRHRLSIDNFLPNGSMDSVQNAIFDDRRTFFNQIFDRNNPEPTVSYYFVKPHIQ